MNQSEKNYEKVVSDIRNKRRDDKYGNRTYEEMNKEWDSLAMVVSIIFEVGSFITAFSFVYFLLLPFSGEELSAIFSTILLVLLALSRRKSLKHLCIYWKRENKIHVGFLALTLFLGGGSIYASFCGSTDTVDYFTPEYEEVAANKTEEVRKLEASIDSIRITLRKAEGTTWKGKVTRPMQRTIDKLTPILASKETRLDVLLAKNTTKNEEGEKELKEDTKMRGYTLGGITMMFEFVIGLCAFFREHYDFRCHIDKKKSGGGNNGPREPNNPRGRNRRRSNTGNDALDELIDAFSEEESSSINNEAPETILNETNPETNPETETIPELNPETISETETRQVSTDWIKDKKTGFKYRLDGRVVMMEGSSVWLTQKEARKRVQSYINKNTIKKRKDGEVKRIGNVSTNLYGIERYNFALVLLGAEPIKYEMKPTLVKAS